MSVLCLFLGCLLPSSHGEPPSLEELEDGWFSFCMVRSDWLLSVELGLPRGSGGTLRAGCVPTASVYEGGCGRVGSAAVPNA